MESFPVDIDPEQLVRWLMVERRRGGSGLEIRAWRVNESHPVDSRLEDRLGDEEREDINDETTVARLEISPAHAAEKWRIVISVETEIQPIDPDQDSPDDDEEPIDLETFYLDFLRSPSTTTTIAAQAESAEAERHLRRFLGAVEADAHVPEGASPGTPTVH